MATKEPLPPTYFLAAIVVALVAHFLFPVYQIVGYPWRLLGLVPLSSGVVLNLVADKALKNHETTVKPFEESRTLIIDGIFGVTRNPMYLGMVLILLGIALLLGSASPFAAVLALAVLLDQRFIAPEEEKLERKFGDVFRDYQRKVRRWV